MSEKIVWTAEAEAKLKDIPFFVRPFARKKIEKYAQDNSFSPITIEIYDQAKKNVQQKIRSNELKNQPSSTKTQNGLAILCF